MAQGTGGPELGLSRLACRIFIQVDRVGGMARSSPSHIATPSADTESSDTDNKPDGL